LEDVVFVREGATSGNKVLHTWYNTTEGDKVCQSYTTPYIPDSNQSAHIQGFLTETHTGIGAANIAVAGSGYVATDTFTVDTGSTLATGEVTEVDDDGGVVTFTITATGEGYTSGSTYDTTATAGIGAGLRLTVTTNAFGVSSYDIADGGSGYSVGATVRVDGTTNKARATVMAEGGRGAVTDLDRKTVVYRQSVGSV
jgi:hypothetical protein